MTRTREVGAWKKLANASERIPNIAVKARPLDRAYHFAVFKSHAASIPAISAWITLPLRSEEILTQQVVKQTINGICPDLFIFRTCMDKVVFNGIQNF